MRRVTPRLPEAAGPTSGRAGTACTGVPLSLLVVGESPVAGVGVATQGEAITARFAQALAAGTGRPVAWRAFGMNGATVSDAQQLLLPQIPCTDVDMALLAFGVNDTTAFRPVARWRADLHNIWAALHARCAPRLILLSGVPPLADFPALPQPLRSVMGLKAQALDAAAQELAAQLPHTIHVPFCFEIRDPALLAHDGYHPSAHGCNAWAACLAAAAVAALDAGASEDA